MATKAATKTRVTKKQVIAHRTRAVKDTSPVWEGCETWSGDEFHRHFRRAMDYYRLESEIKTYKPVLVRWMESVGCTKADIAAIKKVKDNRISTTMGAIAHCLIRGMQPQRADFNNGRDTAAWLRTEIEKVLKEGENDREDDEDAPKVVEKVNVYVPTIQDRLAERTSEIIGELEGIFDDVATGVKNSTKLYDFLVANNVVQSQLGKYEAIYKKRKEELEQAQAKTDPQLKEAYSFLKASDYKRIFNWIDDLLSGVEQYRGVKKASKKARVKKAPSKASAQPIARPVLKVSPPISAMLIGIKVESELIGETTPILPVDKPAYKQIKPT